MKLSKNFYAKDLNNDGLKEVAIYPAVCGNSHKSLAYIYSEKNMNSCHMEQAFITGKPNCQ